MNDSTRNALLHFRPNPANLSAAPARQLLSSALGDTSVRQAANAPAVGDIELSEDSTEPRSNRARQDAAARIPRKRLPGTRMRSEDAGELIKAAAFVAATILALRLYAAIASPSPW